MTTLAHVRDVDATRFDAEVIEGSKQRPVVVDFWAPWCAPCRTLGPILERLAEQMNGRMLLVKVDVDREPQLAERYGVQSIPAVIAFRDGKVVDRFTGAMPPLAVSRWLERIVPSPAEVPARQAAEALARGDRDAARRLADEALAADPAHAGARLIAAELALDAGDAEAARRHLEALPERLDDDALAKRSALQLRLEAGGADVDALRAAVARAPDDLDAVWSLAHALAARGEYDEALGLLLDLVRRDRSYRDDGARKAMLRIFEVLGPDHPLTGTWRARLAATLY